MPIQRPQSSLKTAISATVAQNQTQHLDKNTGYAKDTGQLLSISVVQLTHKDIS